MFANRLYGFERSDPHGNLSFLTNNKNQKGLTPLKKTVKSSIFWNQKKATSPIQKRFAGVAELVDARDLKSLVGYPTCRFESGPRHLFSTRQFIQNYFYFQLFSQFSYFCRLQKCQSEIACIYNDSKTVNNKIDSTHHSVKKPFQPVSEIPSSFFSRHKEYLSDNLRQRRVLGLESEFKVVDDIVYEFMIFDKRDDFYFCPAVGAEEGFISILACNFSMPERRAERKHQFIKNPFLQFFL